MTIKFHVAAASLALLWTTTAAAQVTASNAWVRAAPPDTFVLAAYAELNNKTDRAIALTQVTSPQFARAELHETTLKDGKSFMRKMNKLIIGAGDRFRFMPNGPHIMLIDPKQALPLGASVELDFHFDDGQLIAATAQIQEDAESTGK